MKKAVMPYHECPSFDICSAPKCPLDPDIKERDGRYPEEEKCRANKPTRQKISMKYPNLLPYQGLFGREWHGRQRWLALTPEQRNEIATAGAKRLKLAKNRHLKGGI